MKKLTSYMLSAEGGVTRALQAAALMPFTPIGQTQVLSYGFVPPRADTDEMIQWLKPAGGPGIAMLRIETKSVPKDALDKRVDEIAKAVEDNTGRKPGRKERKMIREDALLELLPRAFPKAVEIPVWFDLDDICAWARVGSVSEAQLDHVISALIASIPGLVITPVQTEVTPQRFMTELICGDHQSLHSFAMGTECQLQSQDETKATVIFQHHQLDAARSHIAEGKLPLCMAIEYNGRVSFRLHDNGRIDKIQLLDDVMAEVGEHYDDAFTADWFLYTEELALMLDDLIEALGGVVVVKREQP